MATAIKKELSETRIPLMKTEDEDVDNDFSFEKDDEKLMKKEHSYDNLFKHENNSVDLFLKEMNSNTYVDVDPPLKPHHISPTKPLNLKNLSQISLQDLKTPQLLDLEPLDGPDLDLETDSNIIQDIPMNPNSPNKFIRIDTSLKGPREVYQTPKKLSPKKAMFDASPPKVMKYDVEESSEDEKDEIEDESQDEVVKSEWIPLSPKRSKPLPELQPASTDTSFQVSPKHELIDDDDDELKRDHSFNLTTEDLKSIKKLTIEEKLDAVLNTQASPIIDHDRYLEDAINKRTKSVVKRRSYYDDMLLSTIKNRQEADDFEGLAEMYETNIRNTPTKTSLKLDLNRSNSLQSQLSIASGERILETSPVKQSQPIPAKLSPEDNSHDLIEPKEESQDFVQAHLKREESQESLPVQLRKEESQDFVQTQLKTEESQEFTQAHLKTEESQEFTHDGEDISSGSLDPVDTEKASETLELSQSDDFTKKASNHIGDLTEISSNIDIFNSTDIETKEIPIEQEILPTPRTPVKSMSHSRQSSITDLLSPYKMGQLLVQVGSNLKRIVSSHDLNNVEELPNEINVGLTDKEELVSRNVDVIDFVPIETEMIEPTANSIKSDTTLDNESDIDDNHNEVIGNSTELNVDGEASTTLEDSSSLMEISKTEYQIGTEFDDDPHSFSLEIDSKDNTQDSVIISPKIIQQSASNSSSPQMDILSIWQSQPEYQHVPRQKKGTRCESGTSTNSSITKRESMNLRIGNNIPLKSHLISKRIVSQEFEDEDILPNISGDSDFGSGFKKFGIKVDEDEEDDLIEDVVHVKDENKQNVQNIWRSGTIRGNKQTQSAKDVQIYSDEDHQVKNAASAFQVNQPLKTHKQHQASIEVETIIPDDEFSVSIVDETMKEPLKEVSESRINVQPIPVEKEKLKLVNGESGRLFIKLNKLVNLALPNFRSRSAKFCVILDNGYHRVQTDYFKLDDRIEMGKEFEIICQEDVNIILTFKAKYEKPSDTLVEVQERETVKSKSFFGKLFNNKHVIVRTKFVTKPAEFDPWTDMMAQDGSFGKVIIKRDQFFDAIEGKLTNYKLPMLNEWNVKNYKQLYQIGNVDLDMMFLPRVSKFEILPTSIKQLYEELSQLREQKSISHEGYLFQEGGDCKIMKRRFFKLQDSTLTAFNEDSFKTRCKINLTKVVEIISMNDTGKKKVNERNFSDNLLPNSFKLRFANGEIIEFVTSDKEDFVEWTDVLERIISKNHFARQPWVKLMYEKQRLSPF